MKTNKNTAIGCGFLVVYLIYAILTGGVYFSSGEGFGGQRSVVLSERAKVGVWLRPTRREMNLIFVAHVSKTGGPFTPQVFLHKLDPSYRSAQITEASVEYSDGTIVTETGLVSRDIKRRKGLSEATFWSGPLENLVTRAQDCTLTVKGRFTLADGSTEDFEVKMEIPANAKSSRVTTYWMVLAAAG